MNLNQQETRTMAKKTVFTATSVARALARAVQAQTITVEQYNALAQTFEDSAIGLELHAEEEDLSFAIGKFFREGADILDDISTEMRVPNNVMCQGEGR